MSTPYSPNDPGQQQGGNAPQGGYPPPQGGYSPQGSGYAPSLEEYGYARYGIRKDDIDLNFAISRAIDELRGKRDGIPKILVDGGLSLRNMWYWPVVTK